MEGFRGEGVRVGKEVGEGAEEGFEGGDLGRVVEDEGAVGGEVVGGEGGDTREGGW